MLDKTLPYYDYLMRRPEGTPIPQCPLPEGYTFTNFKKGDEGIWAEIETAVDEFDSVSEALDYFEEEYGSHLDIFKKCCIFVENPEGKKIATATYWWLPTQGIKEPWLHWIAVHPEYQGRRIGLAIVAEVMSRGIAFEGDRTHYLHTQTWSYKAIGVYQKLGFVHTREKGLAGYANDEYDKAEETVAPYLRPSLE